MYRATFFALLVSTACREAIVEPTVDDADGDGYLAQVDCNDDDANVHPGAIELCDGIDNNCSGTVDDALAPEASVFYADTDEDGAGDPAAVVFACDAPSGFVTTAGDCDDGDARFHPGATEDDCSDSNDYNCDGSTGFADSDGDGFAACEDCDDANNTIFPGRAELCDEVDNNCDGNVDEDSAIDAATWYADTDDDGFGDALSTTRACAQPEGYVADNTDCNDDARDAYPGYTEICDGIDNDCDRLADEPDAVDASTAWVDADGDGFGNDSTATRSCTPPAGYTDQGGDCNDGRADAFPGATEVCDGIDNNCNDATDEGFDLTWFADADDDGHGAAVYTIQACDPGEGWVRSSDDCDDQRSDVSPAAAEVCDEVDNNCNNAVDEGFDQDGDGVNSCSGDCDDNDPLRHANFPEACDDIDHDCSGDPYDAPSEVLLSWYPDSDDDGHGSSTAAAVRTCVAPEGYVLGGDDCDDSDPSTYAGAAPVCDDVDHDCDGQIDFDGDNDGFADGTCGGSDCDDSDAELFPGETGCGEGASCAALLADDPALENGYYELDPDGPATGADPYTAWCDMLGGGWTLADEDTPFTIAFTGQPLTLPVPSDADSTWEFTLYGASGGDGQGTADGGRGGTTTGTLELAGGELLTVFVGGRGAGGGGADTGDCFTRTGGYNGGGTGTRGGSGGGGATDVRLGGVDLSDRVLVAGGGGGCGYADCDRVGGAGGGLTGGNGTGSGTGYGATQTGGGTGSGISGAEAGSFGLGGSSIDCNDGGGGGGGWYGGSAGSTSNTAAGGGSGYLGSVILFGTTEVGTAPVGNGAASYRFQ